MQGPDTPFETPQELERGLRAEVRSAPPSLARDMPKALLRLSIEGIKLAAKDGAYFGLGNLWGEMDSSDPYLLIKSVKGDVVHKTEFVPKNLNPKWYLAAPRDPKTKTLTCVHTCSVRTHRNTVHSTYGYNSDTISHMHSEHGGAPLTKK